MKRAVAVAAALLAGCLSLNSSPPRKYYVLNDLGTAAASTHRPRIDRVLLVSPVSTGEFYDTQSLVFSRAPRERAYYQFAAWTERPGIRMTELLIRRLNLDGTFRSVASTTAGAKGDLILDTRLDELYYDASSSKGIVRVELSAELVDRARGTIVAQHGFEQSAPALDDTALEAVPAFDRAVTALLGDLSTWIDGASIGTEQDRAGRTDVHR